MGARRSEYTDADDSARTCRLVVPLLPGCPPRGHLLCASKVEADRGAADLRPEFWPRLFADVRQRRPRLPPARAAPAMAAHVCRRGAGTARPEEAATAHRR